MIEDRPKLRGSVSNLLNVWPGGSAAKSALAPKKRGREKRKSKSTERKNAKRAKSNREDPLGFADGGLGSEEDEMDEEDDEEEEDLSPHIDVDDEGVDLSSDEAVEAKYEQKSKKKPGKKVGKKTHKAKLQQSDANRHKRKRKGKKGSRK